jgi:hypothetical protein
MSPWSWIPRSITLNDANFSATTECAYVSNMFLRGVYGGHEFSATEKPRPTLGRLGGVKPLPVAPARLASSR